MKTMTAFAMFVIGISFNAYAADPGAPAHVDGISHASKTGDKADGDKGGKGGKDKLGDNTQMKGGKDGGGKDKMHGAHAKSDGDKGDKGGKDKMGSSAQMKGDKDKMGVHTHMKDGGDKGGKGGKDKMDMPQHSHGASHPGMSAPAGARDGAMGR